MHASPAPRIGGFSGERVWPSTGTKTPSTVADVFGPRPFSSHIATVGYDYDWHRGVDVPGDEESDDLIPIYAPIGGCVIRHHYGHFSNGASENANGHEDWAQQFEEADPDGIMTVAPDTSLNASYASATVADSGFLASARMRNKTPVQLGGASDCDLRTWLTGSISNMNGGAGYGIAFHDETTDEYVAVDYDNATLRFHAADADGADTIDGTSSAVAGVKWLRILWDQSAGDILIQYSTTDDRDPGSWTTAATVTAPNFTASGLPAFRWSFYIRKFGTAEGQSIPLGFVGCVDDVQDVGRFGNWLRLSNGDETWTLMHMSHIAVAPGAIVTEGQLIGYMGREGFDARSGIISSLHLHFEYELGNSYTYDQDDVINPLGVGILPRTDETNNVSVVRTEEDDPNTDACHKLAVTVARGDQGFDLNVVTLTGNSATRTINFNTRAGLNVDNDVPDQDGVYIEATAFDEDSLSQVINFYFQKSVVGTTFLSASVKDTEGSELWAEAFSLHASYTAQQWFDGKDAGETLNVSDEVTAWVNKGADADANSGVNSAPQWNTDHLEIDKDLSTLSYLTSDGYARDTVFFVYRVTGTPNADVRLMMLEKSGPYDIYQVNATRVQAYRRNGSTIASQTITRATYENGGGAWEILGVTQDGTHMNCWLNDSPKQAATTPYTTLKTGAVPTHEIGFRQSGMTASGAVVDLGEYICFDEQLSDAEMVAAIAELDAKWNG